METIILRNINKLVWNVYAYEMRNITQTGFVPHLVYYLKVIFIISYETKKPESYAELRRSIY
jgi:hypothetical protein